MRSLRKLLEAGHSLIVIEHNLDVIRSADWLIDLGPEGGSGGGLVVAEGPPEEVREHRNQPHRQGPARLRRRPWTRCTRCSEGRVVDYVTQVQRQQAAAASAESHGDAVRIVNAKEHTTSRT